MQKLKAEVEHDMTVLDSGTVVTAYDIPVWDPAKWQTP